MEPWFAALARPTAAVPSAAAHNNALAWRTSRAGAVCERASPSSSTRCPPVISKAPATATIPSAPFDDHVQPTPGLQRGPRGRRHSMRRVETEPPPAADGGHQQDRFERGELVPQAHLGSPAEGEVGERVPPGPPFGEEAVRVEPPRLRMAPGVPVDDEGARDCGGSGRDREAPDVDV